MEAAGIAVSNTHTMVSAKQLLHMSGSTGKCELKRHWNSERMSRESVKRERSHRWNPSKQQNVMSKLNREYKGCKGYLEGATEKNTVNPSKTNEPTAV